MNFVPAVQTPKNPDDNAYFFAFIKDKLLVYPTENSARVPTLAEYRTLALTTPSEHYLGTSNGHPCYAIEIAADAAPPEDMTFKGLRDLFGLRDDELFWVAGRAVQVIAWEQTHQYCGRCGTPTQHHKKDRARECPKCQLISYPRLSPAIIVRVEKGDAILLARNHRFPQGRYSVLAGFVDPGETLEHAVAREVREEVGIEISDIHYFASQPWPFPNSLMLGFTAKYVSGEIQIQDEELAEADWFTPDNLPELPPHLSIARKLIEDYLDKHR